MKKSINVKDFIQMMPAVSSQLSQSRNVHSHCDDESQTSKNFLSTIKNKIKKRKNNQDVFNHTLFVRKETIQEKSRQSSQIDEWLQEQKLLQQKFKTLELRNEKNQKMRYRPAKLQEYELRVQNKLIETINPQQLLAMTKKDKLNPFQLFLRKKNMIKMKIKLNRLSCSTQVIKQELRNRSCHDVSGVRQKVSPSRQKRRYLVQPTKKQPITLSLSGHQTAKFKSRTLPLRRSYKGKNNAKTQNI